MIRADISPRLLFCFLNATAAGIETTSKKKLAAITAILSIKSTDDNGLTFVLKNPSNSKLLKNNPENIVAAIKKLVFNFFMAKILSHF